MSKDSRPFHLMIKPIGASCNLACEYCYYLEKSKLYPEGPGKMDEATLERMTEAYLKSHPGPELVFGWQGGEPLLMGLEFFKRAVELQKKYAPEGVRVSNALQTNGTLINDAWAEFFAENGFLIGISIDGPTVLHDLYRRDRAGSPSHARVIQGLQYLKKHKVDVNALVTVNRANSEHPMHVYRFLVDLGLQHLQFIPIVEREDPSSRKVTPWTVRPEAYGNFLCEIFDHWSRYDIGKVFIQQFESALNVWVGGYPTICVFGRVCGRSLVVEYNGDLYACDHFVYPEYKRGIIEPTTLLSIIDGTEQEAFGMVKADVSADCLECPVGALCGGDCPKHRLRFGSDKKPISYLCPAYKRFFTHSAPAMQAIAAQIR